MSGATRIVNADQIMAGYYEWCDGVVVHQHYHIITKVAHDQYLVTDPELQKASPHDDL